MALETSFSATAQSARAATTQPTCPKCGNHTFLASNGSVLNPDGKFTLIYCDRCGYPVAAAEQFETSVIFQEIVQMIRKIAKLVGIPSNV